ncbi:hypothetical protein GC207_06570 [bacterium]|nr:hypothetical protein [bacterium]
MSAIPVGCRLDSPPPLIRHNSHLNRRLNRYATVLLSGRPYRPPNHLREVCKILRVYVRLAERDRKRNPEMVDPRWHIRQLEQQRLQEELDQALARVCGPESVPHQNPVNR